ncbi:MAG TPA: alpha-amylase family glycosyl hydrolase [Pyrinomonadaceae bacterium]|nr:alpha-amylase family glycosyl hydrolase [Pyrinomonadaceae bacterium]
MTGTKLSAALLRSLIIISAMNYSFTHGVAAFAQGTRARDFSKESARGDVPQWVRGGAFYEIFPRSFSARGDFAGVTAELDRLKELGVNILWLMPVHPTGQEKKKGTIGSPYAVRDYYAINPAYGTKDDLKRLVAEAHRRGLKVIIDIVANHTSWDSVLMSKPEFYTRDAAGKILPPVPDWADVADLNYDNPALRAYMLDVLKFWLREYDLDGFRCDVAGFVPTDFWERARAELEKVKPDIVLLAEWDSPDLLVKAFDADYAWSFFHALDDAAAGRKPASVVRAAWEEERGKFPRGALHMRFIDNHDERRAIARLGERGMLAASAVVLTLDGVPLVYNGTEVGDTAESGAPALFERLPIFWQIAERRPEFPRFFRQMLALRRSSPALQQGEVVWVRNGDESRVVTYLRRAGDEEFLVAVNLSNEPFTGFVEAGGGGATFTDITPDINGAGVLKATTRPASLPALALDGWGFRIFRRQK